MTAVSHSSLLRRTIPLASVVLAAIAMSASLVAQNSTTLPTLRSTVCPEVPIQIQVGDISFSVNCGRLDPKVHGYQLRKDSQDKKFVGIVALLNFGALADNLQKGKGVNIQDLVDIKNKIDELCADIACDGFKESSDFKQDMSSEKLSKLIVAMVCDKSIQAGADADRLDVRYQSNVKTMRLASTLLLRRFDQEIASR